MSAPLKGKKIIVTRDEKGTKQFSKKILHHGGIPIEVPLLTIACDDDRNNQRLFNRIDQYNWIFFTSANGVECFFQLISKYQIPLRKFKPLKIAVVGHKTEEKLKNYHLTADFIPTTYNADTMAREFLSLHSDPGLILLVRGNLSRDILPVELSKANLPFDTITVYKTVVNEDSRSTLNGVLNKEFDFLTFTSPSAVEAFCSMTEKEIFKPCVCIGTTTEERAKELGIGNILTPKKEFTMDAMIETMVESIKRSR